MMYANTWGADGRPIRVGVPVADAEGARRAQAADGAVDVTVHSFMSLAILAAEELAAGAGGVGGA